MKLSHGILLSIILYCLSFSIGYSQGWLREYIEDADLERTQADINFYDVQEWAIKHFAETEREIRSRQSNGEIVLEGDGKAFAHYIKYKRWEWYWSTRINPDGTLGYPSSSITKELSQSARISAESTNKWSYIGLQSADGGYWGMGRAECMGFHPTDKNTFYIGSHGGGVWKTIDGGQTYIPIGDQLPITQVGEILVDFENPQVVYISLGPRGGWVNKSMGVYKSLDGGNNWQPTGFSCEYADGYAIEDMVMSETEPSIILVAREDGLWKTENGGNTWSKVAVGYFNDLAWKPSSSNVVYAAKYDHWGSSEIYKSTDRGLNWNKITALNIQYNQLRIAVTPANPDMISYWSGSDIAIYTSIDEGISFQFKGNSEHNMFPIFISPNDEKTFYAGGLDAHQSMDGGINWNPISNWYGGHNLPAVHADVRNIYYSPIDPDLLYFCNDGGVYSYKESTNKWTELTAGLHIAQYYRLAVAQSDPEVTTCGSQDNGGSRRNADKSWKNTNGGDAMVQQIDPTNADIMYTAYINGELFRSIDAWASSSKISSNIPGGTPSGDWVTPYMLDPNNSSIIYAGYDNVWKSEDRGDSWTQLTDGLTSGNIHELKVAPSNSNVIYISRNNRLWKTENGGVNWTQLPFPGSQRITRIAINPKNANRIWVVQAGWIAGQKCFNSNDGGVSWINMSRNLPNVPTNVVFLMEGPQNGVYIGNDVGVYYRNNTVTDWIKYEDGLPNTNVNDLAIQKSTGILRAATWGRGLWEIPIFEEENTIDCNGDLNGIAFYDDCGVCAGGNTGIIINSSCCNPSGLVEIKKWNGIPGGETNNIPVSTIYDELLSITEVDFPLTNREDNFGVQLMALLCAPETGNYTFWIASDDQSQLYLSLDTTSENKTLIAAVEGWTAYRDFDKYAMQQSAAISLESGKHYYLEMLMKESGGGEHFSIAWQKPGDVRKILTANYLNQNLDCNGDLNGTAFYNNCGICAGGNTGVDVNSNCCNPGGVVAMKKWNGITGGNTADIPVSTIHDEILSFSKVDFPLVNSEDNFGIQLTAFLCPPETGSYTFLIASDDNSALYLSADSTPENKELIASVDAFTTYQNFYTYPSQQSVPVMLEADKKYYLEMLMKESGGGEHFSVAWQMQGETLKILKAVYLNQNIDCNGDLFGLAYLDSCNTCVGGNTGRDECIQDCNGIWGGDASPGSPCNDGNNCTMHDYFNTNCECIGEPEYPNPSYAIAVPTCETPGKIDFTFTTSPGQTHIDFSLDSGLTYPLTAPLSAGTVFIDTLSAGNYQILARWSESNCPVHLGNETLSVTTGGDCDDGDECTINDTYDTNCECIGEPEYPNPSYTITDPTCETPGKIDFTFINSPGQTHIEFSLDSGFAFPLIAPLNAGNAYIDTLSAGDYQIMARWSETNCPVLLGNETLSVISGGVCDDGNECTTNDNYDENCVCIGDSVQACITGIKESSNNVIKIYPNPASNEIYVEGVNGMCPDQVWIRDIRGVLHGTNYSGCSINLGKLSPGLYILTVDFNGTIYQQKLVIEVQSH